MGTVQSDSLLDFDTRIIIPIEENEFLFVFETLRNYANKLELFPIRFEVADADGNRRELFSIRLRPQNNYGNSAELNPIRFQLEDSDGNG